MKTITVRTKEELESAKERNYEQIIVEGSLADNLKKAKKIAVAGPVTIGLLTAALAAIPLTGGLSVAVAAPIATLTGLEIAAIIFAATMGVGLIIALFKGYEEISYETGKMVLKKKQQ
ncbi:hypothetical protein [Pseudomonas sp. BN515]|uniref:hypothetical protein n=1 Tax=Pseudomonas sp. BN515 TaxID=2567892 RepID=UPI0024543C13|nr:hypothetical protein [Pseudomonas sp. BN515]MDH4872747.1 hypothetical protein [Pseudomonas sp. BN515]